MTEDTQPPRTPKEKLPRGKASRFLEQEVERLEASATRTWNLGFLAVVLCVLYLSFVLLQTTPMLNPDQVASEVAGHVGKTFPQELQSMEQRLIDAAPRTAEEVHDIFIGSVPNVGGAAEQALLANGESFSTLGEKLDKSTAAFVEANSDRLEALADAGDAERQAFIAELVAANMETVEASLVDAYLSTESTLSRQNLLFLSGVETFLGLAPQDSPSTEAYRSALQRQILTRLASEIIRDEEE